MKVVIMAGGKGTRIASIANDIPKPMIKIGGKPILEHEIECLRNQGFKDLIITVSHLGDIIMNYFGDGSKISPVTKKPFGVQIEYYFEKKPLGNAGALIKLKDKLTEDFLLLNADALFDVDFNRFVNFHKKNKALVTLFAHANDHPYDSGLLVVDSRNYVLQWLTKEDQRPKYYKNIVNAGLHIISPKILNVTFDSEKVDLDRQILKPLAGTGKMICYNSPEYTKDMGTPERYYDACSDYELDKIHNRNLQNKQKAIFLDRDGTINKYIGYLKTPEEFELIKGSAEAIKKINKSGYLAIVITNQPIIARGEVTVSELQIIHNKMETMIGNEGAYVDAIYYCPHHPDSGFEGEIPELKIKCDCRKPKPGLILQAAKDYNIDLSASWMIGDSKSDIEAGRNAGCKTALIGNADYKQNIHAESLLECINMIIND